MNCMTYSSSYTFSTFNSMSISVNNSNFTSVFFKDAYHANLGTERKLSKSSAKSNASIIKSNSHLPKKFVMFASWKVL